MAEIRRLPMLRTHRRETMERFWKNKNVELLSLRRQMKLKREQVRAVYPFNSWSQFLQDKAKRGQEEALAVLRSRKKKVWAERPVAGQPQASLGSIARMKEILGHEPGAAWKYRLDNKGTVIFSLPDGGIIRDSGEAIHFRPGCDGQAKDLAEKLAQARWGQTVSLTGQTLKSGRIEAVEQEMKPKFGPSWSR